MADPDSCSMTPPLSPLIEVTEDLAAQESPLKKRKEDAHGPVTFTCLGEALPMHGQSTHSQGYLQRGELERLLERNDTKAMDNSLTTELFDQQFVTLLVLDDSMDILFYLFRQQVDKISSFPLTSSSPSALHYRQNIRQFFDYLKSFVLSYSSDDVVSTECFIQRLLRHLQALLIYIGPLYQLPSHVLGTAASRLGSQSTLPSYHIFHMHLDIRWSLIELLHILSIKCPEGCGSVRLYEPEGDHLSDCELFGQLIRLTLWDIVMLAISMHAKMSVNDYQRQTPYTCSCIQEFVLLLIKLLQHRHNKHAKQSFWSSLYPVLQTVLDRCRHTFISTEATELDSTVFTVPPEFTCPDPVGFCWWLLLHFSQLYQCDGYGVHNDIPLTGVEQNNYFALQSLLKTTLTNRSSEGQLRCYLRCCLSLSQLWGPNPDIVSLLWEHFYKRLNDHFRQADLGIEGLTSMCKTPLGWLEQCRQRCLGNDSRLANDSSYNLFLRLLAVHLASTPGCKTNLTWNRVKGRFYTKFHVRRMQELTEVGLVNFSSLFLTLAMVVDTEDVIKRMCQLLDSAGLTSTAYQGTIWRAMFVAILLYIETAKDIGFLADKLVTAFNSVCRDLGSGVQDSSRYTELFSLISQYLEFTQDVLEMSSSFGLSQHKLIGTGITDILKVCRENELRNVLSFCQAVLSRLRLFDARVCQEGAETSGSIQSTSDRMWSCILPFTKSHSCTQTPPPQIADVAASFTLLCLNSPPSIETGMKENFLGLYQYFGWYDSVNVSVSCRFLCHLLPNQSAMDRLSLVLSSHETHLIAAWLRCCWQLPSTNNHLTELSRLVLRLSEVRDMFTTTNTEMAEAGNAAHDFIAVLGKKHSQMTDLRQKLEFQTLVKDMLGDIRKHISHALSPGASGDKIQTVYLMGGLLTKHCAQFLYIKSQPDCMFPLLLERLALPRILLTPNKSIPPLMLAALRQSLYMYIQGTSKLDFRRDPYIQRKVKELVVNYLPRFPLKSAISISTVTVHPLVAALTDSCTANPAADAILFRQHILSVVCSEFMSQRSILTNHQLGLTFLAEIFSRTKKPSVIASDSSIVMTPVLELVLQNDSSASTVLNQLLSACVKDESKFFRNDASHAVEMMVTSQIMTQQARVMRTLEVISKHCPDLLIPIIPALTVAVRASETKRGVGLDKQLRIAYFALLANLGEEGQQEKSKLLSYST